VTRNVGYYKHSRSSDQRSRSQDENVVIALF